MTDKDAMEVQKKFSALPAKRRRQVAAEAFREMQNLSGEELKRCPTCLDYFPIKDFVPYDTIEICPRCVFVMALYQKFKIKKKLAPGVLAPGILNSSFRQILEEEYYLDPAGTYEKYLGEMIEEAEKQEKILRIKEEELSKILSGWEFILLSPQKVKSFPFSVGDVITLRPEHGEDLQRKIFATHQMPKKYAAKYGAKTAVTVLYIPEVAV